MSYGSNEWMVKRKECNHEWVKQHMDLHFQLKTSEVRKKHKRWPTKTPTNGQKSRSSGIIITVPIKKHGHSIQRGSPFTKINSLKVHFLWLSDVTILYPRGNLVGWGFHLKKKKGTGAVKHCGAHLSPPFIDKVSLMFFSFYDLAFDQILHSLVVGLNPKKIYSLNVGLNIVQYLGLVVFNFHLLWIKTHEVDPI